jgi:hypothetical protein
MLAEIGNRDNERGTSAAATFSAGRPFLVPASLLLAYALSDRMRAVKVRIICDGKDLAVGRFVARFVAGICRGIVDALKSPPPNREITFEVEGAAVRLWVDDVMVPMDGGQGFAHVIILDTLRGMLRHLKGIDPQGNVRIVTNLEAQP